MRRFRSAAWPAAISLVATSLGLGGCATPPDDIATTYISPMEYRELDCEQIAAELRRVSRQTQQLHSSLEEEADADQVQMAVGLLLLWPTLFWLEGGDGPQAQEYARLKGEYDALEEVSRQKRCRLESGPGAAGASAPPARSGASGTGGGDAAEGIVRYTYILGDEVSLRDGKRNSMEEIRRLCMALAGARVRSQIDVRDGRVVRDEINTQAATLLSITVLNQTVQHEGGSLTIQTEAQCFPTGDPEGLAANGTGVVATP